MDFVISTLSENQYFSAGFGLFGVGALAAAGKRLTAAGLVLFRRHCITSLGMNRLWSTSNQIHGFDDDCVWVHSINNFHLLL